MIPTKVNLVKKGVSLEVGCALCNGVPKTEGHVLRECSFARAVCFTSPFGLRLVSVRDNSIKEWLVSLVDQHEVDFDNVCMLLWAVWQEGNAKVWEGKEGQLLKVVQRVLSWHQAFQMANSKPRLPKKLLQTKSVLPQEGWVKINVDGATRLANNVGGVGVVIWDWNGQFVDAGAWRREGIGSVLHIELLAVMEGLRLAQRLRVHQVVVESDSTKALVAAALHPISFMHVPRTYNGIAHRLAQFAISIGNEVVWFEDPLDLIQDLLIQNLMQHLLEY